MKHLQLVHEDTRIHLTLFHFDTIPQLQRFAKASGTPVEGYPQGGSIAGLTRCSLFEKKYLGPQILVSGNKSINHLIVHECYHAAVMLHRILKRRKMLPPRCNREEFIAYAVSSLDALFLRWRKAGYRDTLSEASINAAVAPMMQCLEKEFWLS